MEQRPPLRQVLAGRQPRRVEAGLADLVLGLGSEEGHRLHANSRGRRLTSTGIPPGRRAGCVRCPAAHGLERRRSAAGRRGVPRAAPDREGAADRAARRRAARRGRLPRPDRAGARRAGARAPDADAPTRAGRDRAGGAPRLIVFGGTGLERDFPGAREALDAELARRSTRRAELAADRGPCRAGGEIDDRVLPAEAGLDRTTSLLEGLLPGQEPVSRLHFRGHPDRGLRVLELDGLPAEDAELLYEGKRSAGHVRCAAPRRIRRRALVRPVEVPADGASRWLVASRSGWSIRRRRASSRRPIGALSAAIACTR